MKKLKYTAPDVEVQKLYQKYCEEFKIDDPIAESYDDEIAMVDARVNRLFNPTEEFPLNPEIEKLFIEYIKVKAFLKREQRLEQDRIEKRKHLKSVPVSELNRTVEQCLNVFKEHVPENEQHIVISKMNLIMAYNNNLI